MDAYQHYQWDRYHAIEVVVLRAGEFAYGGSPGSVAQAWLEHGFTAAEVREWLDARCFDAAAAASLREHGHTPERAARRTDAGLGAYVDTVGYKVSNGDLGAASANALLRRFEEGS